MWQDNENAQNVWGKKQGQAQTDEEGMASVESHLVLGYFFNVLFIGKI